MQNVFALEGDIFRHAQRHREAFCRSQHGVGYASIAAGGIEQSLAQGEFSAAAAFRDDVRGGAVFNRASGVIPLGLSQNLNTVQVARQAMKPEKRSVADPLLRALSERRCCTFWPARRRRGMLLSKFA